MDNEGVMVIVKAKGQQGGADDEQATMTMGPMDDGAMMTMKGRRNCESQIEGAPLPLMKEQRMNLKWKKTRILRKRVVCSENSLGTIRHEPIVKLRWRGRHNGNYF
ncbi:putative phosphatidate cytidylyltransferase 1 isoform X1 [Sesbania bispinosa]|nr:putative phosphatidate cytidylyltransferase 1 isoform X1 [Sesbania bispinosa]